MKYVDVCIGNEEDAELCLGFKPDADVEAGHTDAEGYKGIFQQMMKEFGFKYVVSTLRESFSATHNGWKAMIYNGEEFYTSKRYDIDPIIDLSLIHIYRRIFLYDACYVFQYIHHIIDQLPEHHPESRQHAYLFSLYLFAPGVCNRSFYLFLVVSLAALAFPVSDSGRNELFCYCLLYTSRCV